MPTITWSLQGGTPTTIGATDILQFAGSGGFDSKITVDEFNDSMHVKGSGDENQSSGNTPNNVKFISQAGGTGGDSQADWGDGTEDLDAITEAEATLEINVSHGSAIALEDISLYAYDGSTTTAVPTGVTFYAAEVGDANWTNAEGSASALALDDQAAATSHDLYVALSAGPQSVGLKDAFSVRLEFTYF